jgi:glycosyltransferase involved in cell wall biosynthesis
VKTVELHSLLRSGDHIGEAAFLRANTEAYERLVARVHKEALTNDPEATLRAVSHAAMGASEFHPGRFADGTIENVALEIGHSLPDRRLVPHSSPVRRDGRRRVLHVATQVSRIGGLTRMMRHWIENDKSSRHSLVIVNQADVPIPIWLVDAVRDRDGIVLHLQDGSSLCDKAMHLRRTAQLHADVVILHHYPFDVVPIVAFASSNCPPVALLNLADHQFWLGSSVADVVISLRTPGSEQAIRRRFSECNVILPIPLVPAANDIGKTNARRMLGIPKNQTVLLSVGRAEKYRPCAGYDFVGTIGKLLDRRSNAHLYVVGESRDGIAPYVQASLHERLHFVGPKENPTHYRVAADIYLESFPFGSQTALLEAALSELPVVPAYAPLAPLLVANDDSLCDLVTNASNEQEYLSQIEHFIENPQVGRQLATQLRQRVTEDHTGGGWLHHLASFYETTSAMRHSPRRIPPSECCAAGEDIGLSLWHARADGLHWTAKATGRNSKGAVCRHASFLAAYGHAYGDGVRLAALAVIHEPWSSASWRVVGLRAIDCAIRPMVRRVVDWIKGTNRSLSRAS